MKFIFSDLSDPGEFERLGNLLKSETANDTITVSPSLGKGIIQRVLLADGLQVIKWDIALTEALELQKTNSMGDAGRIFTLSYIFTPGNFSVRSFTLNTEFELKGAINLLLDSGNHSLNFTLPAGALSKCIIISMRADWIKNEFSDTNKDGKKILESLLNSDQPALFYEAVSTAERKIITELDSHFDSNEPFYMKGSAMLLLSYFFHSLLNKEPEEVGGNNILHYDKIKKAEQILMDHLARTLPSLNDIARQVALSESTLKRYFKAIFAKSIYEYYLQKKMEFARTQLMEKKLLVKEVAHMLGYEKTSSFIRIFKKYYKLPPGHLQKEDMDASNKQPDS